MPRRFCAALLPAFAAGGRGVGRLADLPLGEQRRAGHPADQAALLVGHQQQRRADRVQRAGVGLVELRDDLGDLRLRWTTFWLKKMTPPASPCLISRSSPAGGVRPRVAVDHPLARHLLERERGQIRGPGPGRRGPGRRGCPVACGEVPAPADADGPAAPPGAARSQSGKRPAAALAASAAARATATTAAPARTQDCDLRNGLPLGEPAAAARPDRRFVMILLRKANAARIARSSRAPTRDGADPGEVAPPRPALIRSGTPVDPARLADPDVPSPASDPGSDPAPAPPQQRLIDYDGRLPVIVTVIVTS